jgi:hypothetical protein
MPIQSPRCAIFSTAPPAFPFARRASFSPFACSVFPFVGFVLGGGRGVRPGFLRDGEGVRVDGDDDERCFWVGVGEVERGREGGLEVGRGEWSRTARRAVDEPSRRGVGERLVVLEGDGFEVGCGEGRDVGAGVEAEGTT